MKMNLKVDLKKNTERAVEVEGVKTLWSHSVADLKLRYKTYIGNSDSTAYAGVSSTALRCGRRDSQA
jgi:hypothetical protein